MERARRTASVMHRAGQQAFSYLPLLTHMSLSWSPARLVVTAERPCTDESTRGNAGRRLSAASTRCGGGAAETLIASVLAGGSVTPLV